MESVGIFYGPMVGLLPFGIFWVRLVYFSRFGMLYDEKSGNTVLGSYSEAGCSFAPL
jgi:hypothetical protein